MNDITNFDYVIAAILALFLLRGLCIGFVRQLAGTAALVGSYWLAGEYAGQLIPPYMQQFIQRPGAVFLISFGGIFLVAALCFMLIGSLLRNVLEVSLLGWADRIVGGLLGTARAVLVTVLIYMLTAALLPSAQSFFQGSLTVPYLNQGAEIIRQVIRDASMRNDLTPKVPKLDKTEKKKPDLSKPSADAPKVESATIQDQSKSAVPDRKAEVLPQPR
ncbi:CvpA family protein [Desulfobulbus sp. F4]|nr:CvpA family protein [Desulfobulbus sp. F3]MCW5201252.1 CvpA family protein [Desulfobulbus sp. F4]